MCGATLVPAIVDEPMSDDLPSALEEVVRPLLELMQVITGLETTFVTSIDWVAQDQEVLFSRNTAELQVAEGSTLNWSDSMCRLAFLSGYEHTSDVGGLFPGSLGADLLGMQTFFAVPILVEDRTIGTVCGASRSVIDMDAKSLQLMRLVSQAIAVQLATEQGSQAYRRRAESAEVLASTDVLTGLPNRRAFTARWEEELARSARHGSGIALLLIDVDEFKVVNDDRGHDVGDEVLRAVSHAMQEACRADDFPARIGGDEFAVVLSHADAVGAMALGVRIQTHFARACLVLGVSCSLSIGVGTSAGSPRRSLMADADHALYRSKHQGGNRIEVWDEGMAAEDGDPPGRLDIPANDSRAGIRLAKVVTLRPTGTLG